MSLKTLTLRVQSLESARAQRDQHTIVVFVGTPEADAKANMLIKEEGAKAEQLGKDLKVLRIRWKF